MKGVLRGPKYGYKATASDITDLKHGYPVYTPGKFHLCLFAGFPFSNNTYVTSLVMEELYPKYVRKGYEAIGVT